MKQNFYFKFVFLSLLMMVMGMNVVSAQTEVTLWQEDFSSYSKDDVPSGGTYNYVCTKGSSDTKIFSESLAGGKSPELLVSKKGGTFTATIPLSNIEGDLTLTFKTNKYKIAVSSATSGITGGLEEAKEGLHTTTFSGITTSTQSITIVFTSPSSNNVRLDDIVLKGFQSSTPSDATLTGISLSGDYPTTFTIGDSFSHDGMTVTATYDDDSEMDVTSWAVFDGYDMSHEGIQTVTVSYTYGKITETTTYDITLKAIEGDWYSLVTSTDNLAEGDKVIIVCTDKNRAMSTTQEKNNRKATDVNITNSKAFVPKNGDIQVLTLEGNDNDGWYFNTGKGYLYAASSDNNYMKTESQKDGNNNALAKITILDGSTTVAFQGTNTHNVMQNNGSIFSCYAAATLNPIDVYKLDDGKQEADLSFSEESVSVNLGEVDAFESPTFNNPNNLPVTATSTNEDVAVFDVETGKIVINGSEGTAEITVTSAATDEFRAGKASITVTVKKAETSVYFTEPIVEITYGDNYDKQKATAEGYSGNLVYTSSDESVVKFHGNSVIDILGPGAVTITATAPATETTSESSATYLLKIYAPADGVEGEEALLNEMFDDCTGSRPADNPDDKGWNGTNSFKTLPETCNWTVVGTAEPAGNGCLKLGTITKAGDATSPSFTLNGTAPLKFDIAPWTSPVDGTITGSKSVTITLTNATFEDGETTKTVGAAANTPFTIGWNHFEYDITGSGDVTINFHGSSQFFLDNVVVGGGAQPAHEINLKFSSAGYLTWVATADVDFAQTTGVTAYKITEATPKKITMVEVDKVAKGEAVMLKGSDTVQLKRTTGAEAFTDNKMQACTDGSVTGNGVDGVTNTDVYVLGNGKNGLGFYMLKGTLQAGKGYLRVTEEAGNAKQSFIGFEVVTGVDAIEIKDADDAAIYNLQGIRVAHPQKGIYVKNGKKYVK